MSMLSKLVLLEIPALPGARYFVENDQAIIGAGREEIVSDDRLLGHPLDDFGFVDVVCLTHLVSQGRHEKSFIQSGSFRSHAATFRECSCECVGERWAILQAQSPPSHEQSENRNTGVVVYSPSSSFNAEVLGVRFFGFAPSESGVLDENRNASVSSVFRF